MTPSATSRISSRWSMACGFSSFAITGTSLLCEAIIFLTSVTSAAVRTNERATASIPCFRPNSRSLRSFTVMAGIDSATPGRLMPLCSPSRPSLMTSHRTSLPRMLRTRSSIKPSLRRMRAPGESSRARSGNVVDIRVSFPGTSWGVMVTIAPLFRKTGFRCSSRPVRILGPCRSCRMQTVRPSRWAARRRR